jgi:Flp pilus assembly pilin Flp
MLHLSSQEGQGLVEYALLILLMAVAVISILQVVGPAVRETFGLITDTLESIGDTSGAISAVYTVQTFFGRQVRVTVDEPNTVVTVSIIQGSGWLTPSSRTCNPSQACRFMIFFPSAHGKVSAAGGGGQMTADW